ncbi:hypothetical protein C0993_003738 [Termitomyces sp. T159_Od127]|nr:hypothetical protein C0993_003738 [Termitomyces sp. T159_Od127]
MPDDVAREKVSALRCLGATVEQVRPVSIVDKKQNLARQHAAKFGHTDSLTESEILQRPHLVPSPSSSNRSNFDAHFDGTGPEIWRQTNGHIDAFISGAGTGGTIAGVGQCIKSLNKNVIVALADPEGSGLYNKIKHGVMFDRKESEGTKRRHQVDTVVEGMYVPDFSYHRGLSMPGCSPIL